MKRHLSLISGPTQARAPMAVLPAVVCGLFFLALLAFLPTPAHAVKIDLSGKVFKPGAKIVVTSTDTVPNVLVYQLDISGTGTSTGGFIPLLGNGDSEAAIKAISPQAASYLHFTLANLTGKIPASLGAQQGFSEINNAPIASGSSGVLITQGHVSVKINKNGTVTASLTGLSLKEETSAFKRLPAFAGTYTLTSGFVSVYPLPATSGSAQPGVISLINTHFALAGPDAYISTPPGNANPVSIRRGGSLVTFFVLQNNGPASDNFVVKTDPIPAGFSAQFFDGKTDVTSQVIGSGYPVNNLPSAGQKLLKMKVLVGSKVARGTDVNLSFGFARQADSTAVSHGGVSVFAR